LPPRPTLTVNRPRFNQGNVEHKLSLAAYRR
jgi:hypothetical protein